MIIIRECRMEDASAIQKFNSEEMGYDYPLEDTKRSLEKLLGRKSDKIFVAVQDGTVVGYAHANDYDLLYMPHLKNIMGIAVASAYRRRGIGKMLLKAVEEQRWQQEEYREELLLSIEGIAIMAELFSKFGGYPIARKTDTVSWLKRYREKWVSKNKESELAEIEKMFLYLDRL